MESLWRSIAVVLVVSVLFGSWALLIQSDGPSVPTAGLPAFAGMAGPAGEGQGLIDRFPDLTASVVASGASLAAAAAATEMIEIPAGDFQMGCDTHNSNEDCYAWEQPLHTVGLSQYHVDKYEVTNAQYADFLSVMGNQMEGGVTWLDASALGVRIHGSSLSWQADVGYEDHPVVEVTWYGARAYCQFYGNRLPTEAEWEKAARGITDTRKYPWGSVDPNCAYLNFRHNDMDCVGNTTPVGSYPSWGSPTGVLDAAGNVFEWASDWFDASYYATYPEDAWPNDPTGPVSGTSKVVRGGGWHHYWRDVRVAYRGHFYAPTYSATHVGFRCVSGTAGDSVAPAATVDLLATPAGADSVTLTWTAPGDDGNAGEAALYAVRYADWPIDTEYAWASASDAAGVPVPSVAGTPVTMTVKELMPGRMHYFAVKAADEAGNWSPLSNVAEAYVRGPGSYETGEYPNLFHDLLGASDLQTQLKIDLAWWRLFNTWGLADSVYREIDGANMAYIQDTISKSIKTEGMSYGMMIAVQLDKREHFDRLWTFAKTKMQHSAEVAAITSTVRAGYFAWDLFLEPDNEDCLTDPAYGMTATEVITDFLRDCVRDPNPAPDGEEWFAMALMFASGRWGDGEGIYHYRSEANKILHAMRHQEEEGPTVDGNGVRVTNMFTGTESNNYVVFVPYGEAAGFTDPSYHVPGFYELWADWADKVDSASWRGAAQSSRRMWANAISPEWGNAETGLMPNYSHFTGEPHSSNRIFSHDAWRVAMNVGIDYAWLRRDNWHVEQSERLQGFLAGESALNGGDYGYAYELDGTQLGGPASAGLVAMNAVASLAARPSATSTRYVQELWNEPALDWILWPQRGYYDGLLYLLGMLNVSGNFRIYQPGNLSTSVSPATGGELVILNAPSYGIEFPPGASTEPLTVTARMADAQSVPIGTGAVGRALVLEARDPAGAEVTSFAEPFTVTIGYSTSDISGLWENSLGLFWWDSSRGIWIEIPAEVDTEENTLTAVLDHLTAFAVLGDWRFRIYLPAAFRRN